MKYFDSHAHYNDRRFNKDRNNLLMDLPMKGVTGVVNAGACLASSRASVDLAKKYPYIYASGGVHPHEASGMTDETIAEFQKLCAQNFSTNKKIVAIGEIGLDFHYDNSPRDVQRFWFKEQLALAEGLDMPVIIHSREAMQETFDILKSYTLKGVLHCYSGHLPMALEYIKMGFYIGIGGVVTYKNAAKTVEVAANIPLDRLLIETDCPYLPPEPFRGKRNDSTMLSFIVDTIAKARNITPEEVASATFENAKLLFGID